MLLDIYKDSMIEIMFEYVFINRSRMRISRSLAKVIHCYGLGDSLIEQGITLTVGLCSKILISILHIQVAETMP